MSPLYLGPRKLLLARVGTYWMGPAETVFIPHKAGNCKGIAVGTQRRILGMEPAPDFAKTTGDLISWVRDSRTAGDVFIGA